MVIVIKRFSRNLEIADAFLEEMKKISEKGKKLKPM